MSRIIWAVLLFTIAVFAADQTVFSKPLSTIELRQLHTRQSDHLSASESPKPTKTLGKVRRGQTLASILGSYRVPYPRILKAATAAKSVFDVRRIRAGASYTIVRDASGGYPVRFFIYDTSPVEAVVFDLAEPVQVYRTSKPTTTKICTANGTIDSSLWSTFTQQDLDSRLFYMLADIFAWTVDFHHLQKGDGYKIIYEEQYAGGKRVDIGRIRAAKFTCGTQTHYAFLLEQNGCDRYFDENGDSLQKAFLRAPIKYGRITSGFSKRRFHPILKKYRKHLGIDYAAPMGTPIMTVGDGVVVKIGRNRSAGKFVRVRHNQKYKTEYMHMSRYAKGLKVGSAVKQGDTIGYVGRTGWATGPHVDLRLYRNGQAVNFSRVKLPAGKSIKPEYRDIFAQLSAHLIDVLDEDTAPVRLAAEDHIRSGR